jgi:hypothetical protein
MPTAATTAGSGAAATGGGTTAGGGGAAFGTAASGAAAFGAAAATRAACRRPFARAPGSPASEAPSGLPRFARGLKGTTAFDTRPLRRGFSTAPFIRSRSAAFSKKKKNLKVRCRNG